MNQSALVRMGGPAFPSDLYCGVYPQRFAFVGMTLLDYFAAAALTGLAARQESKETASGVFVIEPEYRLDDAGDATRLAEDAYWIANEMLAARRNNLNPDERIGGDS